ncbi:hypothetical protein TVAG_111560 [Trichomonas vaginalis G3]|uniref:D-glutamate cyclase-like C-terminal domain-containing protein n=1 Tax=Trichomonas vaginalis (strain ATCC PRA-98 / G3) TaxID=412133 RepID=A2F015_TRIV3|nr:D-glutamate cyclase protein [Trichomonas vaginalis G3]EAY01799.1 hypothetical protein TVAG_111560 [Trichomonas vaginalis G3]KAI5546819.1 D-glutamate cyclase protein [Trichomonas vaginalis G3]|eukprot:XP_001330425.1 hypothetical protein [Trichomonas vaginalis G3]
MDNQEILENLESIVFVDPQNVLASKEWMNGSIGEAAHMLLECDKKKPSFILTGSCYFNGNCETDGPIGAGILCRTLRSLGFNTNVLTDSYAALVVISAVKNAPVYVFDDVEKISKDMSFLVTVGRPSKCKKSLDYLSPQGEVINNSVIKLDKLLKSSLDPEIKYPYKVISICDRLQECGAGNLECIARGADVACTLCDTLIMSGCSHWGSLALAAALIALSEDKETAKMFIELCDQQSQLLDEMLEAGSYDGVTGKQERSIDGMQFDAEHISVTHSIVMLIKQKFDLF